MNPLSEADSARRIWSDADHGVVARIARAIGTRGVHAARVVVLVPYAQLMNVARQRWAEGGPPGFAPRFETTRNWVRSMGGFVPGDYDIAFDMARDLVTAQSLLAQAGFAAERHALAGRLVELALQLAPLAAARAPASRASWMQEADVAVSAGTASDWFRTESALNSIALAWAASSAYATDALLQDEASSQVDLLIVLEGLQADPLVRALAVQWADACLSLPLYVEGVPSGAAAVHEALDPEDEAERAAACVLQALADGCAPVALAATDRALTRRISAQLAAQGVHTQDETGWKLSTTRAAATLMNALRACAHDVSSDQVLDWLKSATAAVDARAVSELEARLRREGLRDWRSWCALIARSDKPHDITLNALTLTVEARRKQLASARSLGDWLRALRRFLEECGLWDALADDLAGSRVIEALWLDAGDIDFAGGCHTLTEFSAWVRDVLEAGSFTRGASDDAPQVVVLPLHQLIGRSFGALVVPGCDDKRLPASPEPPGTWTVAQRAALGLPSREALEAAQRAAWAVALRSPRCTLLWRASDAAGEPVRPSPLLQAAQLDGLALPAVDPRDSEAVPVMPTLRPAPSGALLPLRKISTSVYEDLRRCPYRFFALRQLGLHSADELDAEVDKRDFGNWLHAVLGHFHESLHETATQDLRLRLAMIEAAAEVATREAGLSDAEFLPFAAAWPAVRDGYLDWLVQHEAGGASFVESEPWKELPLGALQLVGRLDRIDRMPDGSLFVIDYKTESAKTTEDRVKEPTEDTQLAFYAALVADDTLRAAYVNVGEKSSGTKTIEQADVVAARDVLVAGLMDDFARIAAGESLPPLGEGMVCEHCAARGLCRKDFWSLSA